MATDPLQRFVDAQETVYETALAEIERGRKTSHWMWFIFPQARGLGHSPTAQFYGIEGLEEARAYLANPVLGPRLRRAAAAVTQHSGRTATEIFGRPDDLKLRSSLTLFEAAEPDEPVFGQALDTVCAGIRDEVTLRMLRA